MKEIICIVCPKGCHLAVDETNNYAVTGNRCEKGAAYGKNELCSPVRTLTTTVQVTGGALPRCPVKTDRPIPKDKLFEAMAMLDQITLASPVKSGQIVLQNLWGTGVNIITTRSV